VIKVSIPIFSETRNILNTFILVLGGAVATGNRGVNVSTKLPTFHITSPFGKIVVVKYDPYHSKTHRTHFQYVADLHVVSATHCQLVIAQMPVLVRDLR